MMSKDSLARSQTVVNHPRFLGSYCTQLAEEFPIGRARETCRLELELSQCGLETPHSAVNATDTSSDKP